jgi:hypothetical protein
MDGGHESVANFAIKYKGSTLASGEMPISEFAPTLLAMEELCEQTNHLVNGDQTTASLRIKSNFKPGSFLAEFALIISPIVLGVAVNITTKAVLQIIGFAGSKLHGLIAFTKNVAGGRIEEVKPLGDGTTNVVVYHHHTHEHHIEVAPDSVVQLYQKAEVQRSLRNMVKLLTQDGIEEIEVLENDAPVDTIKKSDVEFFAFPQVYTMLDPLTPPERAIDGESLAAPRISEESVEEDESIKIYKVTTITNKSNRIWRFVDGSAEIHAYIKDEKFLRRLVSHQEHCELGDSVSVRIHRRTTRDIHGKITTKNYVVEVLEVIQDQQTEPIQPSLDKQHNEES